MVRPPPIFRRRNDLSRNSILNENQIAETEAPKTGVFGILSEFCAKSCVHGLVYLGDRKRRFIERVFWAIAIALSLSLCGFGTLKSWQNNGTDRIVLRFSERPVSIDTIPFPAVSICPVTKASAKKFNYTDVYRSLMKLDGESSRNVTPKEFETMKVMVQLCELKRTKDVSKLFSDEYAARLMYKTMLEVEPDMNETFAFCKLFGNWINCDEIFFPFLTDAGFCYTFNAVRLSELVTNEAFFNVSSVPTKRRPSTWNINDGYKANVKHRDSYPLRAIDAGLQYSLLVILKSNKYDVDYLCSGSKQGFKVAFHSPIGTPRGPKHFFHLSSNRAAFYSIEPKYTRTEPKLRKFDPHKRQCYFNTERKLRFYKQYTQVLCILECTSNYTLNRCGCVRFSMLHSRDDKICGNMKLDCVKESVQHFYISKDVNKCDCLPSCSELSYDAHPSEIDLDYARTLSQTVRYGKVDFRNVSFSRLVVSFKDEAFFPLNRVESYGVADILSYIGGFCGLFIGASLLSVLELLYYFTLRLYFNYRSNRQSNDRHVIPVSSYSS